MLTLDNLLFPGLPIALVVLFIVGLKWRRAMTTKQAAREAKAQALHEKRTARVLEWHARNEERAVWRKQWLIEHPVILYYNTIGGITAVVTMESYKQAAEQTRIDRIDERWPYAHLEPVPNGTFLFATESGRELFAANSGFSATSDSHLFRRSHLEALVLEFGLRLEHRPDLFVPYASKQLPGKEQIIAIGRKENMRWWLVESHTPQEFWPITRDWLD